VSKLVRRAGVASLADGALLVWSIADGRRGRRWRALAKRGGAVSHALLLEVDVEGRPSRLELTTPAGMLTLHPADDRKTLHGNVVSADGVRHLRLPWSDEHGLEVDGPPITAGVTARRLARTVGVGEGRPVSVISIDEDLAISELTKRYTRVASGTWRIDSASGVAGVEPRTLELDDRGIPIGLRDRREWPLELD